MSETKTIPGYIDQPNPKQQLEKREQFTFSLLGELGFTTLKRQKGQEVKGIYYQISRLGGKSDLSEVEFEPAGYYTAGEFIATQKINGHSVAIAFTPQSYSYFDEGTFVDKKYIGGNHDLTIAELLDSIKNAMAVATFEKDLSRLPTWTKEYETFEKNFQSIVDKVIKLE